jgi:beta-xylosidase
MVAGGISALGTDATTAAYTPQSPWPEPATTYTNPLNVPIADPFILREGDTYYMYGTTDYGGPGFQVFTSPDLVRWTRAAFCYRPGTDSWGRHSFWAPEVIKNNGRYFLHYTSYSAREQRRNICVAVSDSPVGPFKDYAGPLFRDRSIIDSHIYHDTDTGKFYIYASPENEPPSRILGAELSPDFKSLLTTPVLCLKSEYGWEDLWIEGPIIEKHDGTLYMIFSGGAYWEAEYALGYATAKSPLGPWTKSSTNPILKKTRDVHGAGHNGLARSPDGNELFVVYHRHISDSSIDRVAALDRLRFDKATSGPDTLTAPGAPSSTPQPLPSGAKPLAFAAPDDFSAPKLNMDQWEIFSNNAENWSLEAGQLVIRAAPDDFWRTHDDGENVFLQRIPPDAGDFAIETSVTMNATRINEQAFLTLWSNADNYVTFAAIKQDQPRFVTTVESKGKADSSVAPNSLGRTVCLRVEKRGGTLTVFASPDGKTWQPAGRPADVTGMQFNRAGIGAWSPGTDLRTPARFDYFKVEKLQ